MPGSQGEAQTSQKRPILGPIQGQGPTQAGRQGCRQALALGLGYREGAGDPGPALSAEGADIQPGEAILWGGLIPRRVGEVRDEDLDQAALQFRSGEAGQEPGGEAARLEERLGLQFPS